MDIVLPIILLVAALAIVGFFGYRAVQDRKKKKK